MARSSLSKVACSFPSYSTVPLSLGCSRIGRDICTGSTAGDGSAERIGWEVEDGVSTSTSDDASAETLLLDLLLQDFFFAKRSECSFEHSRMTKWSFSRTFSHPPNATPSSSAASSRLPSFREVPTNATSEEVSAKTLSHDLFDSIFAKRSGTLLNTAAYQDDSLQERSHNRYMLSHRVLTPLYICPVLRTGHLDPIYFAAFRDVRGQAPSP